MRYTCVRKVEVEYSNGNILKTISTALPSGGRIRYFLLLGKRKSQISNVCNKKFEKERESKQNKSWIQPLYDIKSLHCNWQHKHWWQSKSYAQIKKTQKRAKPSVQNTIRSTRAQIKVQRDHLTQILCSGNKMLSLENLCLFRKTANWLRQES